MILPGNYIYSLILLALSLLLIGSWASTFKSTGGKWRFELYYFDFALGAFLVSVIMAVTFGSFGFDGFSFLDDLRLAGKRQDAYGLVSGGLFNLGNMLIVAGISMTAMSVALPIGLMVAVIVEIIADLVVNHQASPLYVVGGALALAVAVILTAMAWREFALARLHDLMRQGKTKTTRKTVSMKGITLSLIGGVFLGASRPFTILARVEDLGLGPYSLGFLFAVGILLSTFVLNLFFMNLPVAGEPIDMAVYFQSKGKQHLPGFLGGVIFMCGLMANLVVSRTEGEAQIAQPLGFALMQGPIIVAMIWGLVVWKELRGNAAKVKGHLSLAMLLVVAGVSLAAFGLPSATH